MAAGSSSKLSVAELDSDVDGNNELHEAAAFGRLTLLKSLIDRNANINEVNFLGWTPLMQAARFGQLNCVGLLIENGANVSLRNRYNVCALGLACANGNLTVVRKLLFHQLEGGRPVQLIEKLVSPLAFASLFNHIAVVQFLLAQSFNSEERLHRTGIDCLMCAAANHSFETMNVLLTERGRNAMEGQPSAHSRRREITEINVQHVSPRATRKESQHQSSDMLVSKLFVRNDLGMSRAIQYATINSPVPQIYTNRAILSLTPDSIQEINESQLIPGTPKYRYLSRKQVFFPPDFSPAIHKSPTCHVRNSFNETVKTTTTEYAIQDARHYDNSVNMKHICNEKSVLYSARRNPNRQQLSLTMHHLHNADFLTTQSSADERQDKLLSPSYCHNHKLMVILQEHCLGSLIPVFVNEEIDFEVFLTLSEGDLRQIGISSSVDRQAILEIIHKLTELS